MNVVQKFLDRFHALNLGPTGSKCGARFVIVGGAFGSVFFMNDQAGRRRIGAVIADSVFVGNQTGFRSIP